MSENSIDRTSLDVGRQELPWENREEKQIELWRDQCSVASRLHALKAKQFKRLYHCTSIPAILLPILGSTFASLSYQSRYIDAGLLLTTGCLVAINTFFNFGHKQSDHSEYHNRYQELVSNIDKEMVKPKRLRIACDVYLEYVCCKMSRLKAGAPDL